VNEGIGSTIVLAVIIVFVTFVSGYMAYNVNYTKAFRMKNKIISVYEKYDGKCMGEKKSQCNTEIEEYAKQISYSTSDWFTSINPSFCDNNIHKPDSGRITKKDTVRSPGYCVYEIEVPRAPDTGFAIDDKNNLPHHYYRIVTVINIRVPIIENWMQWNYVTGDTKQYVTES